MRTVTNFLCGFVFALVALTLGANWSFSWIALGYSGALYWLFANPVGPWGFLIGLTVALEFLSFEHFGLYGLFLFIFWLIDTVFRERLRFTSANIRFTIALAIELVGYILIFGRDALRIVWLPIVLIYLLLVIVTLLRHQSTRELSYAFH